MPEPERNVVNLRKEFREVGRAGPSGYSSVLMDDYNPDLWGWAALDIYDKMRRNDGKVKAILRAVKAPMLSGQWYVDHHTHESSPPPEEAEKISDFAWWALNAMERDFISILAEVLSFLDFGFYPFESVYEFGEWEGKRVVKWKKWGPRHPSTIVEWKFDSNGDLVGVVQQLEADRVLIPADKVMMFTFDEEGGNPAGQSLLRPAYKHWYYKEALYKVDAIQKERHGIGIPDIELPENASEADKVYADELGRNLRTNEKAFIVRPPGMKVGFVQFQGNHVDVLSSAAHHDLMMASSVLAQFLNLGSSNTGSRAISESQQDLFTRSVRYIADLVRGVINRELAKLLRLNGMDTTCELKVRRIGEAADWRSLSVALRNLIEPGALTADANLEHFVREIMDLPHGTEAAMNRSVEERLPMNKRKEQPQKPSDASEGGNREGSRTGGPKD